MADRPEGLSDRELGAALAAVGRNLAFPEPRDLADSVVARLEQPAPSPVRRFPSRGVVRTPGRRLALALAAVLLLAGAAVAGGLAVRGVRILIAPEESPPPVVPTPTPPGEFLFLGERVSLEEARRRAGFDLLLPTAPGLPEPVAYFHDEPPGGRVSLAYPAGPSLPRTEQTGEGMLLMEFRARIDRPFLEKVVRQAERVEEVEVAGALGYWVEGEHTVSYLDDRGTAFEERTRLAGNTLLWQRGDVTLRLESALPMEEAVRIAESIR